MRRRHCPGNAPTTQEMHTNTPGAYSEDTQIRTPDTAAPRAVSHTASVAWQPRLQFHRMVSRPEYLYIAVMRAVFRFCRISRNTPSQDPRLLPEGMQASAGWQVLQFVFHG